MKTIELYFSPQELDDAITFNSKLKRAGVQSQEGHRLIRRWIDARGRKVKIYHRYEVGRNINKQLDYTYQDVHDAPRVHIIGAGPAGYFAALTCIELGLRPIVFEQGKDVRARRRDLRAIQQDGIVNPHSNYCFGEGGAGTYSDGKLYTRAKKRGDIKYVLDTLIAHGAKEDIGIDAHPHIGSNKLPGIIAAIRATIEKHGGEIHFDSEVTDLLVNDDMVKSIVLRDGSQIDVHSVVLATGHSARSIYHLFDEKGWAIEAKSFAMGVRIEHPQAFIDKAQYGHSPRHPILPASNYRLATNIGDRGVFSFCMCPGGLIVPASTHPGELVVNGMSLSRRDSPYANSGVVVAIESEDLSGSDPLKGLRYQAALEKKFFKAGDGTQMAPAQRVTDFIDKIPSDQVGDSSYIPGVYASDMCKLLPESISWKIHEALQEFNRQINGYIHPEALLIGLESRTSAPIRIPRDRHTLMHTQIAGLYPCGEGSGYAGGIMSAALDGQRVVQAIAKDIRFKT